MDRDFDGRLSFEEFMGEETTLERLFKNMDKNNDGVVSKQVGHKSPRLFLSLKIHSREGVHDNLPKPVR